MDIEEEKNPNLLTQPVDRDCVSKLSELVSLYFPQYGEIEYDRLECNDEPNSSLSNNRLPQRFRCSVNMFGLKVESTTSHANWEEAKEATAKVALSMLNEFLRKVRCRQDDPLFGKLFVPLINKMENYKPLSAKQSSEKVDHQPILNIYDELAVHTAREQVFGPALTLVLNKLNRPDQLNNTNSSSKTTTSITSTAIPKTKDTVDNSILPKTEQLGKESSTKETPNPVTLLYQHYQRRSSQISPPGIEVFAKQNQFGAIGNYFDHKVHVPPIYSRKNDAKYEAGRLLCLKIFGDLVDFEKVLVPKDVQTAATQTLPTTTNVVTQKVVVADSKNINSDKIKATSTKSISLKTGTTPDLTKDTIEPYFGELPEGPLKEKDINGKAFAITFNEYIQKLRMPSPKFVFFVVNQSLTPAYCCQIEDFDGHSFSSYAFVRKQDAKEDCAGRIIKYMLEKGMINDKGKPVITNTKKNPNHPKQQKKHHQSTHTNLPGLIPSPPPTFLPPLPQSPPSFIMASSSITVDNINKRPREPSLTPPIEASSNFSALPGTIPPMMPLVPLPPSPPSAFPSLTTTEMPSPPPLPPPPPHWLQMLSFHQRPKTDK